MNTNQDNWEITIDFQKLDDDLYGGFEDRISKIGEEVIKLCEDEMLHDRKKIGSCRVQNHDIDLKTLIEKNRSVKLEIENKLKEVNEKRLQCENYKNDQKILTEELKDMHEAFITAKKRYKKHFKIHYTIESTSDSKQIIFLQFFTQSKTDSEMYSVRLSRDIETKQYELLSSTPKLANFGELQRNLQESKDVPVVLSQVREMFSKIKENK